MANGGQDAVFWITCPEGDCTRRLRCTVAVEVELASVERKGREVTVSTRTSSAADMPALVVRLNSDHPNG